MLPDLRCPRCLERLTRGEDRLTCVGCKRHFDIVDGIPCLTDNRDYYYGEIDQVLMQNLLRDCEQTDWYSALQRLLGKVPHPEVLLHYAVGASRAGWWPLLGLPERARVLDLGCGWGAVSFALAPRAEEVVACDLNIERLRFLQLRATQAGVTNVRPVWGGDTPTLPFPDEAFDLVVLNGVLEWAPSSGAGQPRDIQRQLLREVVRLLRPSGQLLLAIENRWSWLYWRGRPEDHIKLKYISLLPRAAADVYARAKLGRPYRNYTYSYRGYRRLLTEAGFSSTRAVVPLPDYRSFDAVVDPVRPATVARYFAERQAPRLESALLAAQGRMAAALAPSFCWMATKGTERDSFMQRLAEEVASKVGVTAPRVTWSRYRLSPRGVIAFELSLGLKTPPLFVKLPTEEAAVERCEAEHRDLTVFRSRVSGGDDPFPEVPRPVASGFLAGQPYFVADNCPGFPPTRFTKSSVGCRWREEAVRFLLRVHRATADLSSDAQALWWPALRDTVRRGLPTIERLTGVSGGRLENYVTDRLLTISWPVVFMHGDFWSGNLLLDRAGVGLTGVVDWDSCHPRSIPFLDLINAFVWAESKDGRQPIPDTVAQIIDRGQFSPQHAPLFSEYARAIEAEPTPETFTALMVLHWLLYVGYRVAWRRGNCRWEDQWLNDNVVRATSWLTKTAAV